MGIDYQAESWMAWIRHQPDRKRNLRVVVQALVDSPSGLTCDEIEMKTGLSHQTCSATVSHAVRAGVLGKGDSRRPTRTGRMARVIVLGSVPETETTRNKPRKEAKNDSDNQSPGALEEVRKSAPSREEGGEDNHRLDLCRLGREIQIAPRQAPVVEVSPTGIYRRSDRRTGIRENASGGLFDRLV